MTEKSSCVTRVPASTCCSSSWDVTVADPVPEAVRANVLPWTHSTHQGLGAAACWPNWFVWEQPEAELSAHPRLSASTLSRGCLQSQSIRLWVASSLTSSVRCVFSTPLLLRNAPQGGNEVMSFRNRLICQDNGPLTISQGAVLGHTNQMPGNDCPYFLFISWEAMQLYLNI